MGKAYLETTCTAQPHSPSSSVVLEMSVTVWHVQPNLLTTSEQAPFIEEGNGQKVTHFEHASVDSMKILLIHNFTQGFGGADAVALAERQLLEEHGNEITR
jgi:hypothetical protein